MKNQHQENQKISDINDWPTQPTAISDPISQLTTPTISIQITHKIPKWLTVGVHGEEDKRVMRLIKIKYVMCVYLYVCMLFN